MRAAVTQAEIGVGVLQHPLNMLQIAGFIVEQGMIEQGAAIIFQHGVVE